MPRKRISIALQVPPSSFFDQYRYEVFRSIMYYVQRHTNWRLIINIPGFHFSRTFNSKNDLEELNVQAAVVTQQNEELEILESMNIPIVSVSGETLAKPFIHILSDDFQVGKTGADYLLQRGFAHFGFVGTNNYQWDREREVGFKDTLRKFGHSYFSFQLENKSDIDKQLENWIRELPTPIGIMTSSDFRSLHVLDICEVAKVRVPDDIALLGVDNNHLICCSSNPTLSSIEMNTERIGYEVGTILDQIFSGKTPSFNNIYIPPIGVNTRSSSNISVLEDQIVCQAMAFIRTHCSEPITVDDVVAQSSVSRTNLENRFKISVRCTINSALRNHRLQLAQRLLMDTTLSLQEIAERTGFKRSTYLCTLFSEQLGISPGNYRAKFHREPKDREIRSQEFPFTEDDL